MSDKTAKTGHFAIFVKNDKGEYESATRTLFPSKEAAQRYLHGMPAKHEPIVLPWEAIERLVVESRLDFYERFLATGIYHPAECGFVHGSAVGLTEEEAEDVPCVWCGAPTTRSPEQPAQLVCSADCASTRN